MGILGLVFLLRALASDAFAQGTLIPVPTRLGMVFDHSGGFLYVATYDGFVQRVNLASQQIDKSYPIAGIPIALDIAPDDSFLLVTENNTTQTQGMVHRLDLATGTVQDITYPLVDLEAGSFEVAIANNGRAFFTTQPFCDGGYCASTTMPLRQINLATNQVSVRSDVPRFGDIEQNTQIARSADGSRIYLLEGNDSSGPVLTYTAATNSFSSLVHLDQYADSARCAVNRNGTLLATGIPLGWVSLESAADFSYEHSYTGLDGGLAFNGVTDVLYAVNRAAGQIIAYDTNTFSELYRLDIGEMLPAQFEMFPLDAGTLIASHDGRYLAVSTPTGVRLFDLTTATHLPPVIPAPTLTTRRDMIFDRSGTYLYITTDNGLVERYNVATQKIETIADCGGVLEGIDIAPDDSFLLVAQAISGVKQAAVQKIDLATGAITNFNFDRDLGGSGARSVAIASNGLAFFTTLALPAYSGSPVLHQINLSSGTLSVRSLDQIAELSDDSQIHRSADRTRLYFFCADVTTGPTFTYDAVRDQFSPGAAVGLLLFNIAGAVSRDGALLATGAGVRGFFSVERASDFTNVAVLRDYDGGLAFDAVADVLYALKISTKEIVAIDTNTFSELYRLSVGDALDNIFYPLGSGHLVASQDGRFLAVGTLNGIKVFGIPNPLPSPSPTPLPSPAGIRQMVFDHSGHLYATNANGLIYKYDAATNAILAGYDLGGSSAGLDIAPDDSFLLVTEGLPGLTQGVIYKINLSTRAVSNFKYGRATFELAAINIAIASNSRAFFEGLRQIDLNSGQVTIRVDDAGGLVLHSADRNSLCLSPYGNDSSPNFTYMVGTDTWTEIPGTINVRPKALNRNGTLVGSTVSVSLGAIVTLSTFPDFNLTHSFNTIDMGIAFDPVRDVIYGINHATRDLIGYDTNTYAEKYRVGVSEATGFLSFATDSVTVVPSPDGRYIAVAGAGGLHFYSPTGAPTPTPTPTPTPMPSPPTVGLTVAPTSVGKGGTATFTVSLSASTFQDITVNYGMSGNAVFGADYTLAGTPNQVTIVKGQTSATVGLTVTTTKTKGREKATMTMNFGSGYQLPSAGKKHKVKLPKVTVTINNK